MTAPEKPSKLTARNWWKLATLLLVAIGAQLLAIRSCPAHPWGAVPAGILLGVLVAREAKR